MPRSTPLLDVALGLFLLMAFWGLNQTETTIQVTFIPSWTHSTPGELYMALGSLLLVFPAGLLLAHAAWPTLNTYGSRMKLPTTAARNLVLAGLALASLTLLFAALHHAILQGYPITDDENAARFGGQLLATGHTTTPLTPAFPAWHGFFLFLRQGHLTSFDWLGGQLAWAFAELTRTDNLIFALLAALAPLSIAATVRSSLGDRWAALAALLALSSPMLAALSFTTHAHLGSRGFFALALLAWLTLDRQPSARRALGAGLALGAAWLFRPLEITTLAAPLLIDTLLRAWRQSPEQRTHRRNALLLLAGAAATALPLTLLHNLSVTGTLLPSRFSTNELPTPGNWYHPPLAFLQDPDLLWMRFGANLSYNLFMLALWGLGLPTLLLVLRGARTRARHALLLAGIALNLALALLHDNSGLHIVGPIHYSEAGVPLLLLAIFGLHDLHQRAPAWNIEPRRLTLTLGGAILLTNLVFLAQHAEGMRRQAHIHDAIFQALHDQLPDRALILAPDYARVWQQFEELNRIHTFVYAWPLPDPTDQTPFTFLKFTPEDPNLLQAALDAYPDRPVYVMKIGNRRQPELLIAPLRAILQTTPALQGVRMYPAQEHPKAKPHTQPNP
jgi:hypothetical protein